MLGNSGGGGGIISVTSTLINGYEDFTRVGGGNVATNVDNMDSFLLHPGTSSSMMGDSVITFTSPLKDAELRRRARNNAILAKIQELEANASVQAARSERLRMMREEYESLVRKYASQRKWDWGSPNNGLLNGSGDHQNAYQPSNSEQQQFTSSPSFFRPQPNHGTVPSQLFSSTPRESRDFLTLAFSTAGVNTVITGPVRPVRTEIEEAEKYDLQDHKESLHLSREKVKVIITDCGSQTDEMYPVSHHYKKITGVVVAEQEQQPQALPSSSSLSFLEKVKASPNQTPIVVEKDEKEFPVEGNSKRNLPPKMEMLMMLEEEDDDEDESLAKVGKSQGKQQLLRHIHQTQHPKAQLDDTTISISSTSSRATPTYTTSITTEDPLLRPYQRLEKVGKNHVSGRNYQVGVGGGDVENEETSQDTTTVSLFAAGRVDNDGLSITRGKNSKYKGTELTDLSHSDSTSLLQNQHERQRRMLLQQLSSAKSTSNARNKRKSEEDEDDGSMNHNDTLDCSSSDDEEKSVMKMGGQRGERKQHDDDDMLCSSPTTAGATSESIGDSLMDSIQKTPDTLPRDDSELHGIAEVNEEDEELDEIELDVSRKVGTSAAPSSPPPAATEDDDFAETATAGAFGERVNLARSRVNDRISDETGTSLRERDEKEIKGLELHEQINDAEEIRSNNLSSSKLDVPAEEENITHANNPGESRRAQRSRDPEQKNSELLLHEDEGQPMNTMLGESAEFHESQFDDEQIATHIEGGKVVNDSNGKMGTIPYSDAPSAHMSAQSSTTSSFSGGSSAANGTTNVPHKESSPSDQVNRIRRLSSTGSSSTTSSRQQSLDEQVDGTTTTKTKGQNNGSKQNSSGGSLSPKERQTQQSPTLPQSVHKRHHQLEQQVKIEREAKDATPPVGADNMPERLLPNKSSVGAQSAANVGDYSDCGKGGVEKVGISQNPTKGSTPQLSPSSLSLTSSPSSRRAVGGETKAGNSNGNGAGTTGVNNNIRSSRPARSPLLQKQGHGSSSSSMVASGPTGAQNTARRVRLKLNYDDSESDSSEIAPLKALPTSVNLGATATSGQQQGNSINANDGQKAESTLKKQGEDDDFDDFFDI